MSRNWPAPPAENTLHAIGDVQGAAMSRLNILLSDLERSSVPNVGHRVTLGDCTANSTSADDAYFLAFKDRVPGGLLPVVGNHDVVGRTPDQAAAVLGMPAKNYTVDLGYAALIIIGPDGGVPTMPLQYGTDTISWVDGQLQAHSDKPCLIAAHAPLRDTVRAPLEGPVSMTSTQVNFYAVGQSGNTANPATDDADIRAMIADNPNCKAWVSGHTHSLINAHNIVKPVQIGGHTIAAINTSTVMPPGSALNPNGSVATAFITVYDDRIETRWRNHGSHQWVGCGTNREPAATVVF